MIEQITQNLSVETASSVDAYMATWIAISLIAFLLIIVPLVERIPKIGECVSRRWVVVTVTTTLMVAVVINFEHLTRSVPSVRNKPAPYRALLAWITRAFP